MRLMKRKEVLSQKGPQLLTEKSPPPLSEKLLVIKPRVERGQLMLRRVVLCTFGDGYNGRTSLREGLGDTTRLNQIKL